MTGWSFVQYSGLPRVTVAPAFGSQVTIPAPVPRTARVAPYPSVPGSVRLSDRSVLVTRVVCAGAQVPAEVWGVRPGAISAIAPAPAAAAVTSAIAAPT